MSIFSAVFRMSFDGSEVDAGLKRAESSLIGLAKQVAPYFSAGVLIHWAKETSQWADQISDLAAEFETTTTEIMKMQMGALVAGKRFEDLAAALRKVSAARKEAILDPEKRAAFRAHGMSDEDIFDYGRMTDLQFQQALFSRNQGKDRSSDHAWWNEIAGKQGARLFTAEAEREKAKPFAKESDIQYAKKGAEALEQFWFWIKQISSIVVGQISEAVSPSPNRSIFDKDPNWVRNLWDNYAGPGGGPPAREFGAEDPEVVARLVKRRIDEQKMIDKMPRFENQISYDKFPAATSLVSHGNFLYAGGSAQGQTIEREQLVQLKKIAQNTEAGATDLGGEFLP